MLPDRPLNKGSMGKIYTKKGDKGLTSLVGGKKVWKSNVRVEAYGTVDELISWIGFLHDQVPLPNDQTLLLKVQDRLMACASRLACDEKELLVRMPRVDESDILFLEQEIDRMESSLEPLQSFILPGGHPLASTCHIVRNVCRRAERRVIALAQEGNEEVEDVIIRYLNRLADFLFVFARYLLYTCGGKETLWKPEL